MRVTIPLNLPVGIPLSQLVSSSMASLAFSGFPGFTPLFGFRAGESRRISALAKKGFIGISGAETRSPESSVRTCGIAVAAAVIGKS